MNRAAPLAGYVPDHQGQMIVVDEIEIVKVASDLSGRIHGAEDIELLTIREGRKLVRDRGLLDLAGKRQLGDDPFSVRRESGQVFDIADHVRLHRVDGVREPGKLFEFADLAERLSLGVLLCKARRFVGDLLDGGDELLADKQRGNRRGDESQQDRRQGDVAQIRPPCLTDLTDGALYAEDGSHFARGVLYRHHGRDMRVRAVARFEAVDRLARRALLVDGPVFPPILVVGRAPLVPELPLRIGAVVHLVVHRIENGDEAAVVARIHVDDVDQGNVDLLAVEVQVLL